MASVNFQTYYDYEALESVLHGWAEEYAALVELRSIGKSYEGRDLWLMVLTNKATGAPRSKPSFWVDANIHATEVTGCMAALHLIENLLTGYGDDPERTRLLDTTTFYVLPRFNPDGAERALKTPYGVRSSVRPYPLLERQDGLYLEDIDGDGVISMMRFPDPNGDWRISEHDPRVMVKRRPDEHGGSYYRMLPEGLIQNFDGVNVKISPVVEGLDINRNFPGEWRPESDQRGAGPYPASEPEVRAVVQFLTDHPEIHSAITYHTFSGVLLRPHSAKPDDAFDIHDLDVYKALGKRGTELTGWPNVSVYQGFRYHPKEVITGVFDDWAYDHLGMFAWTVELWDIVGEAGVKDRDFIQWFKEHPEEDDLKLMAWNDEHGEGVCFVDWHPFEHPQLGPVELGGWHPMYAFRNPPPGKLEETCAKSTAFSLAQAQIAPLLRIPVFEATALGGGLYSVRAIFQNEGYLPTYGSNQAKARKACLPLEVRLQVPEGAELVQGEAKQQLGHLEGRSARGTSIWGYAPVSDRTKLDWVVRAPAGGALEVQVRGGRGGEPTATLTLPQD